MRFLEERKIENNTKKRKYIQDTEKDAKDFYEDELIEEIRLAKLNLYELKGKSKTTFNQVITFLLSILTVAGSWIILYGNIYNGFSNLIDFVNKNNKAEAISIDIIQSQTESLKESLLGTIDLTSRVVILGGIVISICIIALVCELILKSDIVDKTAKTELKIEIYTDVLNNKQYKLENLALDFKEKNINNDFISLIDKYKGKFSKEEKVKRIKMLNFELENKKLNFELPRYNLISNDNSVTFNEIAIILSITPISMSVYQMIDEERGKSTSILLFFIIIGAIMYILKQYKNRTKKYKDNQDKDSYKYKKDKEEIYNIKLQIDVLEYLQYEEDNEVLNVKAKIEV